jgi:cyanophycinase
MRSLSIRLTFALLWALAGAGIAVAADGGSVDRGYRHHEIGAVDAPTPSKPTPGLLLMGGGEWPDDAFAWFSARAGHGHIVILSASGTDELQRHWFERIGGVASVQTFVFANRDAASDPLMLAAVRHADGIFLAGGDQSRYIRYWKGTPLNVALDRHVRAGKPLGGTSAGLAILGGASYGALDGGSITSPVALAAPLGPAVTLDHDFLHLPFLADVVTDSHFGRRKRLGRLIAFMARARHDRRIAHPVGLGIDENTALCIDADGNGRVHTGSGGHAWLVRMTHEPGVLRAGAALTVDEVTVIAAGPRSVVHLPDFRVEHPVRTSIARVEAGRLTLDPPLPAFSATTEQNPR